MRNKRAQSVKRLNPHVRPHFSACRVAMQEQMLVCTESVPAVCPESGFIVRMACYPAQMLRTTVVPQRSKHSCSSKRTYKNGAIAYSVQGFCQKLHSELSDRSWLQHLRSTGLCRAFHLAFRQWCWPLATSPSL